MARKRNPNDYCPPGDKLRRNAFKTRLRALRRARKRSLAGDPSTDVTELDAAIASAERALGDAGGWGGTGSSDALRIRLPGSFEHGKRAR
jgi:hypothetical protein